ncbi:MAG: FtsX-like permease family protein [Candidatus Bathyarchaeia archaeon]
MAVGVPREVKFPVSEAVKFSVESIRKRFTRALITAISVILGVAFYAALKTSADILGFAKGASVETQAYQLWMAIISLVLCAVGILNSMLMAVTERTKEIGTMKCLGAMDGHILAVFLAESSILGLIGGALGAVGGWGAGFAVSFFQYKVDFFDATLLAKYAETVGQSVLIAIILSLGATLYPAYHAASLDPADALRYEV